MNSPMKFDDPGIARTPKVTMSASAASTGARSARPPISRRSSEPTRSASSATTKNAGTTTSPWLTAWRIAPCVDVSRSAKIPSTMNPSWATDEYPSTSRAFVTENAITDP